MNTLDQQEGKKDCSEKGVDYLIAHKRGHVVNQSGHKFHYFPWIGLPDNYEHPTCYAESIEIIARYVNNAENPVDRYC